MIKLFAQIDENDLVVNVAVFDEGNEPVGDQWIETGDGLHNRIACPNDQHVREADGYPNGLFYPADPGLGYETWVLNASYEWEPPADQPYPDDDGSYWWWDPMIQEWIERPYRSPLEGG